MTSEIEAYLSGQDLLEPEEGKSGAAYLEDVLVDADALVALAKPDDSNHEKALQISQHLQKRGVTYLLSPFTIAEAATVLSYRVSHQAAKKFLKEMEDLDLPVVSLPKGQRNIANQWFLKQTNRKGVSYFDCYNLALLDRYQSQIGAIFSFDSVYRKNGFNVTSTTD